jgi:hypothetical protein
MGTAGGAGRVIGVLIIVQMIGSYIVNFALTAPLFAPPGFLENAAPHSLSVALAVILGLALGAVALGIAITAFPIFRQHSPSAALWFVALAAVSLAVLAAEYTGLMSMLSLSDAWTKASAPDRDRLEALRIVVASARNWAHYIGLIFAGATLFVLYSTLFRFALVPRALAAFGMAAVVLQIAAVAMPLFGHGVVFLMLAPLGLSQLLLAIWLIAKGFPRDEAAATTRAP